MEHPFDRYELFTDVDALKEASSTPLRKCIRVNTLKYSISDFTKLSEQMNWEIKPVPWSEDGFFIDRKDRSTALGRDLRHLLGRFYVQEASSMLPVDLLQPEPGEAILDMASAPGSKTSQMSSRMKSTGVIIANDIQEKRLQTMKSAVHRLGCTNVKISRKNGQWFGRHMTERFDRVLCDAPCTAQGTARKDDSALSYSSIHGIGKAAKIQRELLESAIHTCKVGGRIVYSTCTLTPEENEEVVHSLLQKFEGKLSIVDPRNLSFHTDWNISQAVEDSFAVQDHLESINSPVPLLRLWPQTYDTEGFFCAIFHKHESTCDNEYYKFENPRAFVLKKSEVNQIQNHVLRQYGTTFMRDDETLVSEDGLLHIVTKSAAEFGMPSKEYTMGIPFSKGLKSNSIIRIDSHLCTLRGSEAQNLKLNVTDDQLSNLLSGKDDTCNEDMQGDIILQWNNMPIGLGLAGNGIIKNRLSRWIIQEKPVY